MNNELINIHHEMFGDIRAIERDGELWFVGKDVAEALGYSVARKAIRDHVDEEDKQILTFQNGTFGSQDIRQKGENSRKYKKTKEQPSQCRTVAPSHL